MDAHSCRKAELHCHLDGLLSPAAALRLQARGLLGEFDIARFQALYPVTSYASWRAIGEFQDPHIHGRPEVFLPITLDYLRSLVPQKVTYAEIMLSSFLGIEFDELVVALERYRRAVDELTGIDVGLIWALGRRAEPSALEAKFERAIALYERGLIDGVALAGDEVACTIRSCRTTSRSTASTSSSVQRAISRSPVSRGLKITRSFAHSDGISASASTPTIRATSSARWSLSSRV